MRVLIACEESQEVCKAFRALGHEAYSCDILPCSGGHPEWHIQDDVDYQIYKGAHKYYGPWDLMVAHPPCTYLANSGVCHIYNKDKSINTERWQKMKEAARFFKRLLYSPIPRIVIENPIMHEHAAKEVGVRQGQLIRPYQFGHTEQKATGLWLKDVSALIETNNVYDEMMQLPKNQRQRLHYLPPSEDRQRIRAHTFPGIAKAMAEQWGGHPTARGVSER